MPNAIRIHEFGGPEVLQWEAVEVGPPGAGEVQLRHTAVGVNFIDVYFRTGSYPTEPPFTPGMEAAGVVEAVGDGVTGLRVGDRVCYGTGPIGSYCEVRNMPAAKLVKVPDGVDDQTAAAAMLKGMTAEYLLRRCVPVEAGDAVLVQAAAGGVGHLLCQWASHLGATVIGTVGNSEKADYAKQHGCEFPILYRDEDVAERVNEITGGKGVRVVYDGVGAATFEGSMNSLARFGTLVSYGQSSGNPPAVEFGRLNKGGSLFVTRPTLFHYVDTREDLELSTGRVFEALAGGAMKIDIGQTFPLAGAAAAHRALEARQTSGTTVLLP